MPNYTNTPPGGWTYSVPQTGKTIGPFTGWIQLRDQLSAHYHAAGFEMPGNIFELVEDQICAAQPEHCGDAPKEDGSMAKLYRESKHTFQRAMQCLTTLVSHRAGSGERPSMEQQEIRAKTCVACPQNTDITPCSICNIRSLKGLINKLAGAKPTSVDKDLKFCAVCHCANSAKVATKHEAIWTHMPQSQKDLLPETCWLKTEQSAKEASYESNKTPTV